MDHNNLPGQKLRGENLSQINIVFVLNHFFNWCLIQKVHFLNFLAAKYVALVTKVQNALMQ